MAFKTVKSYNEERFGGLFLLRNDSESADVIFMYQSEDDVLVADTHYIKSADYSGYVHCCGAGCPACAKGIRVQTKLFIPVYNITQGELQFWDRSMRFENQLASDVFSKFPNPSEFVFRITRHGAAGSIETTYSITAVGKNNFKTYQEILASNNCTSPEYYEKICKDVSISELAKMIDSGSASSTSESDMPTYQATPRVAYTPSVGAQNVPSPATAGIEIPEYAESCDEGLDDIGASEDLDEPVDF